MAKLSREGSRPLDKPTYRPPTAPRDPGPPAPAMSTDESLYGMADRMHPVKPR